MDTILSVNQEQFISRFLAKNQENKHILIAPPGTGKTTTIVKILERILQRESNKPILILGVHKVLITLFYEKLSTYTSNLILLDKRSFIEMDNNRNNNSTLWEDGWIYLSTVSLLKDERFIKRIKSQIWELIIFDEGSIEEIKYLQTINIESEHLLFVLDTDEKKRSELENKYIITEWRITPYLAGLYSFKNTSHIIKYSRTNEENKYLQTIIKFLKETLITESMEKEFDLESASNWYSVEQILLKIRNSIIHGQKNHFIWEGEDYIIKTDPEIIPIIERYINSMSVEIDSKVSAVIKLLNNINMDSSRSILIFFNTIASIKYLHSILDVKGFNTRNLHQSLTNSEVLKEIEQYNNTGGILLVNDYILKGLQVTADVFIHYDMPSSKNLLLLRYSRISDINRAIENYFIVDENNESDLDKLRKFGMDI